MKKLGFIGLGAMGKGMAANLLKSGAELTVYSRNADKRAAFAAMGAAATDRLEDVACADVIFLSLPDGDVVESVVCGASGLMPFLSEGRIVVDCSTISHSATLRIADALRRKNVRFMDAPVSGMESRAADGTLTVMCGGDEETFTAVKPFLDCIGTKVLHVGKCGNGQLAKLVNQLLYDINAAAIAEILPLSVKLGLDSRTVGEIVNSGTGRSHASEYFIPRDLAGIFHEGYPLEKAYKDLVSAAELGAREGIPLPVLGAATAVYQTAMLQGYGAESKGAMIKVYEKLLGVEFRA